MTETSFDFHDGNGPVPAHQHANGGGWVADCAVVDAEAYVGPEARVSGEARVLGEARVFGEARVSGEARVFGNARVSKTPVCVTGLLWPVTISDNIIQIGCQGHTADEWDEFDNHAIAGMDGRDALKFWVKYKQLIMQHARLHQIVKDQA